MNILIVSSWCPFPLDNGSRVRAYNLVRQLAGRGHVLTLLALSQPEMDAGRAVSALEELCAGGVKLFAPQPPPPPIMGGPDREFSRLRGASNLVLSPRYRGLGGLLLPHSVALSWNADMERAVHRAVQSGTFDRALFLEPGVMMYAPARPAVPCVLDCMEVSRFVRQKPTLRVRLMLWKLRHYLQTLAPRFTLWTAASDVERDAITQFVGRTPPVFVVPNGVDLEHNAFTDAPPDPDRLVLNGAPDFAPNAEGAAWFAAEVLPIVRETRPGAHLWVTGRADKLATEHALHHNKTVTLTGYLDDVRPAVQSAAACVVPLFAGGGTRLKILEAMALGVPVVSTMLGAEGIDAVDGEHLLLADTPEQFARAVLSVTENPALRQQLRRNARRFVEHSFGWDAIGALLDALLHTPCP